MHNPINMETKKIKRRVPQMQCRSPLKQLARLDLSTLCLMGTLAVASFAIGFIMGNSWNGVTTSMTNYSADVLGFRSPATPASSPPREVHVKSMCRCGSTAVPIPYNMSQTAIDLHLIQPHSKATGPSKHFHMHSGFCKCDEGSEFAEEVTDLFQKHLGEPKRDNITKYSRLCSNPYESNYTWDQMPNLAVELSLPVFVGVLSYQSPLSLNFSLHNWKQEDFFQQIGAREVFVQLNNRSRMDNDVVDSFRSTLSRDVPHFPPITPMGSIDENLHPGLAIAKFCRKAEEHPDSHPQGDNLLVFLEKDWGLYSHHPNSGLPTLSELFHSINSLAQRGIPFIRLMRVVNPKPNPPSKTWPCPSEGVPWTCTTSHRQRWVNQPAVVSCKWFLRYLEPFALLDDSIMFGCGRGFTKCKYINWEELFTDGRVEWINSQWVTANINKKIFFHHEVDQ